MHDHFHQTLYLGYGRLYFCLLFCVQSLEQVLVSIRKVEGQRANLAELVFLQSKLEDRSQNISRSKSKVKFDFCTVRTRVIPNSRELGLILN